MRQVVTSPSNPPVSALRSTGAIGAHTQPHPASYMSARDLPQDIMLEPRTLLPTELTSVVPGKFKPVFSSGDHQLLSIFQGSSFSYGNLKEITK